LVEAAASYICYVRGQEAFWRRKVMRLVSEVEKESFSREDTLRCFGELIRNGKIKRNEDGSYGVSNTIGYHPEERAAG
jgi:pilus assembly protein FimV